jgi:hypothetical protein
MENATSHEKVRVEPTTDGVIDSVTLARLINEVRNPDLNVGRNYDRTHNRHNR